MKRLKTTLIAGVGVLASLLLALLLILLANPPEILRVGANYAAKMVCSSVFLAGRDPAEVLRDDVQAPGVWVLRLYRVSVDRERGVVRAGLFGFIGSGLAVARPGLGCAVIPDGRVTGIPQYPPAPPPKAIPGGQAWPEGNAVGTDPKLNRLIADDTLTGAGTRAVLVVHHRQLVGERYGRGFDTDTRQLGWSLTKSVTAALMGMLVQDRRLALEQHAGGWAAGDARANIAIADLLSMTSGLHFNESYGEVSDVTRMLFLEPDMAAFARAQPLEHPVGTYWSYSSGTAVILAREFQDAAGPSALELLRTRLFNPLGMTSALIEADRRGTLVGSSYMYATPRDWARYGQFLLQQGVWHGQQILPPGYVAMMAAPVAASGGQYGHGQVWLWGSDSETPGRNPDTAFGLPADTFWIQGHDGQYVAIIPSRQVVIVRMGLTPAREHYRPQPLVRAVLSALPP